MSVDISIPRPDDLDLKFYEATVAAGKLCIQRCKDCGSWTHPARYFCPSCTSANTEFAAVSGKATVYSYTVSHFTTEKAWQGRLPYVTIVAELAEGPRVVAASEEIAPGEVAIGMPIAIVVEAKSPEFAMLWAVKDKR